MHLFRYVCWSRDIGECENEARFAGYRKAIDEEGLPFDSRYVIDRKYAHMEADELIHSLASMEKGPTGIYCSNDIIAVGLLWALNNARSNYFRPSIIASDDIEEGQRTKPMLTTVRLFKEDMARHALYLLLDRLKGGHEGIIRMDIAPQIVSRGSTYRAEAKDWYRYTG